MTANRTRLLWFGVGGVVAVLLAWWFGNHDPVQPEGGYRSVTLRYWRYGSPPGNPVGAWLAKQAQRLDQTRQGTMSREPMLTLEGFDLLWSYSNPTSGWYQFGNMVGRSNVCFWSFALPRSNDPKSALEEFPNLHFHGPESNVWVSLVGAADCSFQTNTVGHGGIRLPVGRSLFVRHTSESNRTYLVQCEEIKPGTWGGHQGTLPVCESAVARFFGTSTLHEQAGHSRPHGGPAVV